MELLEAKKLLPNFSAPRSISTVVYAMNPLFQDTAVECVSELRNSGISAELILGNKKTKWALQRASKLSAGNNIL